MITPDEIKNRTFERAAFGGYAIAEVNEYLAAVSVEFAALTEKCGMLTEKMKVLVRTIEDYRSQEDSIKDALIKSQKMAASVIDDAQRKSDEIMSSAKLIAQNKISEFKDEFRREELRLASARRSTEAFIKKMCETYITEAENLVATAYQADPSLVLPAVAKTESEVEAVETMPDDCARAITPEMEDMPVFAQQEEKPDDGAVESAEEEAAEDVTEEIPEAPQEEKAEKAGKKEEPLQFGADYDVNEGG